MRGKLNGGMKNENYHEDHPRGCGENDFPGAAAFILDGSPPRMRGKLQRLLPHLQLYRITPADAGKTTLDIIGRMLYKDHPRRCGENLHIPAATVKEKGSPPQVRGKRAQTPPGKSSLGSPPQVRGKRGLQRLHFSPKRITPAGAGKTVKNSSTSAFS